MFGSVDGLALYLDPAMRDWLGGTDLCLLASVPV
jgi:hypothetical protein